MENRVEKIESRDRKVIQFILQSGLILAILLMLFGIGTNIVNGSTQVVLFDWGDLFSDRLELGNRFLGWGIFILALTPVFRIVALVALWIRERDWKFVAIALFVLATISISIFIQQG